MVHEVERSRVPTGRGVRVTAVSFAQCLDVSLFLCAGLRRQSSAFCRASQACGTTAGSMGALMLGPNA